MRFSVLTAELSHETNTFSIRPTDLAAFESRYRIEGEAAIDRRGHANTEIAGFCDVGREKDWAITHAISAAAGPGGRVTRAAFEALAAPILASLGEARFDGILLALHGAMVLEDDEDGEGALLARIRALTGPDTPIAITLDPHANVTERMCALANIVVAYRTYPHVDMRETAMRAGRILDRAMAGEIAPRTVRVSRPMLEEANGGRTDIGPMIERLARAEAFEARKDVFAVSINAGFASADIAEVGPTVLVTGEGPPAEHIAFAETLADDIWARRHEVLNDYLSAEAACAIASEHDAASGPLV
ncbi:MAG: M81 family metallopeptidase, partial [Pseudomonadota bacterium]